MWFSLDISTVRVIKDGSSYVCSMEEKAFMVRLEVQFILGASKNGKEF